MFCPASVKAAGHGAIPARRLLDIVRSLPDGEVRVRSLENHWVQIGSGRSTFKLAAMAKDNFPALPDVPAALAEVPGRTLGGVIDRTAFAMSSEESRYTLNGRCWYCSQGRLKWSLRTAPDCRSLCARLR
jgi:DNA polymerase-3 subunit beta